MGMGVVPAPSSIRRFSDYGPKFSPLYFDSLSSLEHSATQLAKTKAGTGHPWDAWHSSHGLAHWGHACC